MLPEPMTEVPLDADAFESKIAAWLMSNNKTETWFQEIATDCLELSEDERTNSAQIQMAKALRLLGWDNVVQKSRGKRRVAVWIAAK